MIKYSLSKEYRFIIIPLILLGVTSGTIFFIIDSILLGLPFIIVCSFLWFGCFISSHKISFNDNFVEFQSIFKTVKLGKKEILSIEDHYLYHKVISNKGNIIFLNLIDNLPSAKKILIEYSIDKNIIDIAKKDFLKESKASYIFLVLLILSAIISGIVAIKDLFF